MQYPTNRARILSHLKGMDGTATAREIAKALDLPCKAVQDALTVLHHMERVTRTGRKF
jgi:predicted ArsR family transcriptional regulator